MGGEACLVSALRPWLGCCGSAQPPQLNAHTHLLCCTPQSPSLPQGISDAYRHIIRGYLVHFHANIMRHTSKRFDYRGGSVGNFFFAGTRIFFRWRWGHGIVGVVAREERGRRARRHWW